MSRYRSSALSPELDRLSRRVVGACIEVHRSTGPGLLESVYEACVALELSHCQIAFQRQARIPFKYRDFLIESALRLDFLFESSLVLELKAVETILPVHKAQVLSYLKLSNLPAGLLINFNVEKLRQGVTRIVNPSHPAVHHRDMPDGLPTAGPP